jgi:hypothetical protein
MKIRMTTPRVFTTLMLIFVAAVLISGTQYERNVRLVPYVVGFPTLILVFVLWLGELRPTWKLRGSRSPQEGTKVDTGKDTDFTSWGPAVNTLGWIFVFFVIIFLFGFFVATPVFLAAFLYRKARLSPLKAVLIAVLTTLVACGFVQGLIGIGLWLGAVPQIIPGFVGGSIVPPL